MGGSPSTAAATGLSRGPSNKTCACIHLGSAAAWLDGGRGRQKRPPRVAAAESWRGGHVGYRRVLFIANPVAAAVLIYIWVLEMRRGGEKGVRAGKRLYGACADGARKRGAGFLETIFLVRRMQFSWTRSTLSWGGGDSGKGSEGAWAG